MPIRRFLYNTFLLIYENYSLQPSGGWLVRSQTNNRGRRKEEKRFFCDFRAKNGYGSCAAGI
ncbi:MAG: hypothetical protein CUN55_21060 [Phototrophicales bacterium]|nr:MAG: hypothetical protein CUN55_21060 [Phototrophicales bacterium]